MWACVWGWEELWEVVLRCPSRSLWSSPATSGGIQHITSPFPPIHASPPGALTAAAARRGPLVKPCCHTPWHLPPYLRSKCQNHCRWMFDFYLFMWCFFSPTPCSWITFKIYCMSKTQSWLPVYRSCQEAVMLVCSAQHRHRLLNSLAWRWKDFCKCLCVFLHVFVYDSEVECCWHSFDDIIIVTTKNNHKGDVGKWVHVWVELRGGHWCINKCVLWPSPFKVTSFGFKDVRADFSAPVFM